MADQHQELARLWTRHMPAVETYLVSLWVRPEDVEELLQETVTQVFQQVDKFDSTRPFLPWVLGFAKYVVLRHRRDIARERHVFSQKTVENLSQAFEDVSGMQDALRRFLEDCFAKLSARAKWLCRLRYEHNMSRGEIAKEQGISTTAVKMGLYRAGAVAGLYRTSVTKRGAPLKRWEEILHAWMDGAGSSQELEELDAWLAADAKHAREYAQWMLVHCELFRCNWSSGQPSAAIKQRPFFSAERQAGEYVARSRLEPRKSHRRIWSRPVPAMAVCLAVVFGLAALLRWEFRGDGRVPEDAPVVALQEPELPSEGSSPAVSVPALRSPEGSAGWISHSIDVQWLPQARSWSVGDALDPGDVLRFSDGRMELIFATGAVMTLVGPAVVEVKSPSLVSLQSGTATTRVVSEEGRGFRVLTPTTEVVDLGTEFGVRVDPEGETDVVVFDGVVDFSPTLSGDAVPGASHRLLIGEAARILKSGHWERLVSIHSDAFPTGDRIFPRARRRPSIITRVADDRRNANSRKFYQIHHEGLEEDVRAYVDRKHEWNGVTEAGLPQFLRGADYVATFNDDKRRSPEITVELSGSAMLYVFLDDRMVVPDWLSESFENTGYKIGLDEGPSAVQPFEVAVGPGKSIDWILSVWARRVDRPDSVVLRPLTPFRTGGGTMLGIAAQPL